MTCQSSAESAFEYEVHRCEQMAAAEAQATAGGTHAEPRACWAGPVRHSHRSGLSVHSPHLQGTVNVGKRRTNVYFVQASPELGSLR